MAMPLGQSGFRTPGQGASAFGAFKTVVDVITGRDTSYLKLVRVRIPGPLQPYTADCAEVVVPAGTVDAALSALVTSYPQLRRHIFDERGQRRGYVNVFVNELDVAVGKEAGAAVEAGDVITIVPSIAGG